MRAMATKKRRLPIQRSKQKGETTGKLTSGAQRVHGDFPRAVFVLLGGTSQMFSLSMSLERIPTLDRSDAVVDGGAHPPELDDAADEGATSQRRYQADAFFALVAFVVIVNRESTSYGRRRESQ